MKNIAIILAGFARSGKDTTADFLVKEFNFKKYVMSDFIKEELKKKGLPQTKEMLSSYGDELREKKGMDAIAKMVYGKIDKRRNCVITGARSLEEIEFFKRKLRNVFVVAVTAPLQKRFKRQQAIKKINLRKFRERDERDKKRKGLHKAINKAGFVLQNNSTKKALHRKILKLMEKIYKE
ncbi:MAG: AAA family ATPase [Candidatus Diapherotrites archaeon]